MSAHGRHEPRVSDETRAQIIAAACALFMQLGYRAVSTRQVAEACGLTQPALYHHFRNKESLFSAVLGEELDRLHDGLERIAARQQSGLAQLHGASRFLLSSVQYDARVIVHDIGSELSNQTQRTLGGAFRRQLVDPLAAMMARAQDEGVIAGVESGGLDPITAAFFFLSLLSFVQGERHHPGTDASRFPSPFSSRSFDQRADLLMRLLLSGLGGPAEPCG